MVLKQLDLFHNLVVGDFLLQKDPLFARLTLGRRRNAVVRTILAQLAPAVPAPTWYLPASGRPTR